MGKGQLDKGGAKAKRGGGFEMPKDLLEFPGTLHSATPFDKLIITHIFSCCLKELM